MAQRLALAVLAAFTDAGLDLPILVAPVGVDEARAVIGAFKQ